MPKKQNNNQPAEPVIALTQAEAHHQALAVAEDRGEIEVIGLLALATLVVGVSLLFFL